jgi:hypothetical protein
VVDLVRMGLSMTPDLFESSPLLSMIGVAVTVVLAAFTFGKMLAKNPQSFAIFMVSVLPKKRARRVQKLMKMYERSKGKK